MHFFPYVQEGENLCHNHKGQKFVRGYTSGTQTLPGHTGKALSTDPIILPFCSPRDQTRQVLQGLFPEGLLLDLMMLFGKFAQPLQSLKKFPCGSENRHFWWGWLNAVFNKVDHERIKAVGPDRAASEWLLRCGAMVQYHGQEKWQQDYNHLPSGPLDKYKIKAIDATDSCIMNIGFDYLEGLEHVETIKLCKCHYIQDECLQRLSQLKNLQKSILHMEIISCGNVTEKGIIALHHLSNLQHLLLRDLPGVSEQGNIIQILRNALPSLELKLDLK